MNDQASVLQRLITASEAVLGLRSPGDAQALQQLCADVTWWSARPAPDGRVTHVYTEMLAEAVGCAAKALTYRGANDFQVYFRLVGMLLPDVRGDFARALDIARRPTP